MSELIYPERASPEINTESPFADYIKLLFSPTAAGMDELVTGQESTFDGATTLATDESISSDDGTIRTMISDSYTFDSDNRDMLLVADVLFAPEGSSGESKVSFSDTYGTRNALSITWSNQNISNESYGGIKFNAKGSTNTSIVHTNKPTENARHVCMLHVKGSTYGSGSVLVDCYVDSVLVDTFDILDFRLTQHSPWVLTTKLSRDGRLYKSGILVHPTGAFTPEEVDEIVTNPYQLFKTDETVEQEYGLDFGNSNGSITLNTKITPVGDFTSLIDFEYGLSGDALLGTNGNSNSVMRIDNSTSVLIKASAVATNVTLSAPLVSGNRYQWYFKRIGATYDIQDVNGNSLLVAVASNAETWTFERFSGFNVGSNIFHGKLFRWTILDHTDSTNSRFWDFNQTRGDYVEDYYNGAIATLVGFPADSGYVRAWGVSDGLTGYAGTYIQMPNDISWADTEYCTIIIKGVFSAPVITGYQYLTYGISSGDSIGFHSNGNVYAKYSASSGYFVNPLVEGEKFTLTIERGVGGQTMTMMGGSGATATSNFSGARSFSMARLTTSCTSTISSIEVSGSVDTTKNSYYDFTKIRGNSTVVPEMLNGQDGTMVGFPTNGVFVPEKNKTLVGQRTNGTTNSVQTTSITTTGSLIEFEVDVVIDVLVTTAIFSLGQWNVGGFTIYVTSSGNFQSTGMGGYPSSTLTIQASDVVRKLKMVLDTVNNTQIFTVDGVEFINTSASLNAITGKFAFGTNIKDDVFISATYIRAILREDGVDTCNLDFTIEAGDSITDTSGNGNHGTVVGGALDRVYDYSGYGEIAGYRVISDTELSTIHTFPDDFRITIPVQFSTSSTKVFLSSDGASGATYIRRASNNSFGVWIGGVNLITLNGWYTSTSRATILTFERISGIFNWYQDGVLKGGRLAAADNSTGEFILQYITPSISVILDSSNTEFTDLTTPSNSLNFDFTAGETSMIAGGTYTPYVVDTVSGDTAELIGGVTYDETGATFDGTGRATLSTQLVFSGDFSFSGEITADLSSNNAMVLGGTDTWIGYYSGRFRFDLGVQRSEGITGMSTNTTYVWTLSRTGSTVTCEVVGVGTEVMEDSSPFKVNWLASFAGTNTYSFVGLMSYIDLGTHYYDFTNIVQVQSGGSLQKAIPETIQGKHAVITNDSVVKWQPILPHEVYSIGDNSSYDYDSLGGAMQDQQNPTYSVIRELVVYTDMIETVAARYLHNNNLVDLHWIIRGDTTFDGTKDSVHKIVHSTGGKLNLSFYDGNTSCTVKDLYLERATVYSNSDANPNIHITYDGCYLDGLFADSNIFNQFATSLTIKGSTVTGAKTSADKGNATYIDSIVFDCCGQYNAFGNIGYQTGDTTTAINTISYETTNRFNYGTTNPVMFGALVTGSNNIASDSSAVDSDIGTQDVDLATYFDVNNQITEAGRTAIGTDTGWNGSTVAGWADAPIITVPDGNITVSFDDTLINTLLDDMVITNHTTVSFDDAVVTPVIENMDIQRTTALVFDDTVVGSSIDTLTLVRHTTVAYTDSQVSCTLGDMVITRSTSLDLEDSVIGTTIEDMVITVQGRDVIPLVFDDSVISSSLEDMGIIRSTSVVFQDSVIGTTIEDMVITVSERINIPLVFDDTLVSSSIEDMVITVQDRPSIPLVFEDTLVSVTIENMDLEVTRTLVFDNFVIESTVQDMELTGRQTSVEFEDAIVNSTVNDMTLTGRQTSVSFDKTIVNSTVEDMAISRRAFLEFEDIVVDSKVEDMGLQRYTSLVFEDAVINSTIDEMYLVTEQLPVFNNLKLKYDKIDRKLIKGHMPLITLTKQT